LNSFQVVPVGFECATASLAVIAVLVQASRQRAGVDAIVQAMQFLGRCGIRPDAETMEVAIQPRKINLSFLIH
jgi:hypothetical protein